jgi:putative membrane protein
MKIRLLLLLLFAACSGGEKVTSTDTISTSGTETTGTTSTTSTGSSGGTASSLNAEDKEFFITAVQANSAEVNLGHLAADKAASADVKKFAARMITDHHNANEELKKLAVRKGVALPAVVNKDQAKAADDLANKVGKDFDRSFMAQMIRDHENVVAAFEKASTTATDPDLKAWVMQTLPTLKDHLTMAKQIEGKLK